MRTTAALLLTLLLAVAGCGSETDDAPDGGSPPQGSPTVTESESPPASPAQPHLVATWSEAQARDLAGWLRSHTEARLLAGNQIDTFIAELPAALDPQELADVDAATTALLVAGFSECGNGGRAVIEGDVVRHVVRKLADHTCVWAPIRVQVFAVPRDLRLAE